MFKYLNPNNPHLKNFDFFGGKGPFRSKQHAVEVANKSLYFTFFFAALTLTVFLASVFLSKGQSGNYNMLIVGSIYLYLSFLVKMQMSRIASVLMTILAGIIVIGLAALGIHGMIMIMVGFVFIASYRCTKATFYYQKKMAEENV